MTRDAVISILRAHEVALRRKGVVASRCSGRRRAATRPLAATSTSWSTYPAANVDLYDYVGITQYIAALFSVPVDVADHAMLVELVRQTAEKDAIHAF
jgi:hypothetical protein